MVFFFLFGPRFCLNLGLSFLFVFDWISGLIFLDFALGLAIVFLDRVITAFTFSLTGIAD
jgi:hypothetical protein